MDYSFRNQVYRLLQIQPELRGYLETMVDCEAQKPLADDSDGWDWQAVHTPVSVINRLIVLRLVDQVYRSRSYSEYRLHALAETVAALGDASVPIKTGPVDVDSLFRLVVGHERIKSLLRYALLAKGAVHCLLSGPPGTAKTLLLSDIGRLEGAEFYVGSTTTKAGLVSLLLEARPHYLVIDELDKMQANDATPLLNLMETGMVTRLVHASHERISLPTKVFAGCNETKSIRSELLDRFTRCQVPAYTRAQFIKDVPQVLVQCEGLGTQMAIHVAAEVVPHSIDIRDAVRVARMARGDPQRVCEIVQCLWPSARKSSVVSLKHPSPKQ